MAKQFKCTNYGVCTEADKDTVFVDTDLEEVDGKYVCPKCGQELEPLEKGGNGGGKGKLIAIIAAAAVVLGGGGAAIALCGTDDDNAPQEPAMVDTVNVLEGEESDLDPQEAPVTQQQEQPQQQQEPVTTTPAQPATTPSSNSYSLGWGTYEGPMQGGKPHGIGGEVKVTKAYTIDLKNGSSKQVARGDRLVNVKFKDGKLVQGYIHRANGEQESFIIGN